MPRRMHVGRASRCLVATLCLSGCGGGVFIGFSSGFDDSPPSVNLTADVTRVRAGQTARFVAAASDENGVDHVSFYRVDVDATTLLGRDFSAPYEWSAIAPIDGRTTLAVFARAVDQEGKVADSATVAVDVTP